MVLPQDVGMMQRHAPLCDDGYVMQAVAAASKAEGGAFTSGEEDIECSDDLPYVIASATSVLAKYHLHAHQDWQYADVWRHDPYRMQAQAQHFHDCRRPLSAWNEQHVGLA
jgi:hypothetical protein